ncbi:hypothetical protein NQD34_013564 [Periophthalmus magnuspinnatus]|uniref:ubiquitin carboxyl-terminal hydrolase 47 n=1 Tax=Periophthalmus magnuspinnatus TaxID=409849 RepID=UPI00145A93D5|nr:ubiquitin carboxyl-terminal hydrolase 47 [Periophthalmus magnuspinnatus]KAJ0006291.1 hypothetical protein NQD34_013564 [Periophthalmus magnuspinnatus]
MSHGIVDILRQKLGELHISDFYGLVSPGLTCYLNSVLQVLFMTEEFRDRIKRCGEDATILDIHLKYLFTSLEKNMARTHKITQILGIANVYEQRDAAEYFEKILRQTCPQASKIFKGELNHMTICCMCNARNNAPDFFWILPLSIKDPHQTYRVDKGFEDFFSKEKVSGENKIYCAHCDKSQDAIVMCEMMQPPEVLSLLLKRFHYDSELKRNIKVKCEAEVPLMLKIKDYTYELYAMVKHYGNLTGGHYIAFIYSFQTKEWYDFNDERVKLKRNYISGKPYLRSRSSYLLMYMKRSRNPENISERPDAEAEETHAAMANEVMETSCNRESDIQENDNILPYKYNKTWTTETAVDTVRFSPSKSQPRTNNHLNSSLKRNQTKMKSSMRPDRLPKKDISDSTNVKTASTLDSQKSVHYWTLPEYSPKTSKRSELQNKSRKRTNCNVKPWK